MDIVEWWLRVCDGSRDVLFPTDMSRGKRIAVLLCTSVLLPALVCLAILAGGAV